MMKTAVILSARKDKGTEIPEHLQKPVSSIDVC